MQTIKRITVVCTQGVEVYEVGKNNIESIRLDSIIYNSDPCDMYICVDKDGFNEALISPFAPIVVDYKNTKQ